MPKTAAPSPIPSDAIEPKAPAAKAATKSTTKAVAKVAAKPTAKPGPAVKAKAARKGVAAKAAKVVKADAKPAAKAPEASAEKSVAKAAPKAAKPPKTKLVRDSFTIPKDEFQVLEGLKARALGLGHAGRKSELLRAGIQALAAMPDRTFLKAVQAVPTLKTGRPKNAA